MVQVILFRISSNLYHPLPHFCCGVLITVVVSWLSRRFCLRCFVGTTSFACEMRPLAVASTLRYASFSLGSSDTIVPAYISIPTNLPKNCFGLFIESGYFQETLYSILQYYCSNVFRITLLQKICWLLRHPILWEKVFDYLNSTSGQITQPPHVWNVHNKCGYILEVVLK